MGKKTVTKLTEEYEKDINTLHEAGLIREQAFGPDRPPHPLHITLAVADCIKHLEGRTTWLVSRLLEPERQIRPTREDKIRELAEEILAVTAPIEKKDPINIIRETVLVVMRQYLPFFIARKQKKLKMNKAGDAFAEHFFQESTENQCRSLLPEEVRDNYDRLQEEHLRLKKRDAATARARQKKSGPL